MSECPITFDPDTPDDERKAVIEGYQAHKRAGRDASHMRADLQDAWLFGWDARNDPTGIGDEMDRAYGRGEYATDPLRNNGGASGAEDARVETNPSQPRVSEGVEP